MSPLIAVGYLLAGLACWSFFHILFSTYWSPLRLLHGPSSLSWLYGNFKQISTVNNTLLMQEWVERYGQSCLIRWLLTIPCLWTVDPQTVNYILTHSTDYIKPVEGRMHAARIAGPGLLVAEGKEHKKQRRVMNPAFGPMQIRELSQIFVEKAAQLRDIWTAQIKQQSGCARINVMEGLGQMTFDIIGLAGFNYNLDALNPQGMPNELNQAFSQIFAKPPKISILRVLLDLFPFLEIFPSARTRKLNEGRAVANRIGMELIRDRKVAILCEQTGAVEKKDVQGRDLLTLLIRANMAVDVLDSQRLSDEEVLAQISSFLAAGHETTSTALTWCLYALAKAPAIQQKLQDELLTVPVDSLDVDQLLALPYLDRVVRETLRLYAPVTTTVRVATKDDSLPVSEPFIDRNGVTQHAIRIAQGNRIVLPIAGMNESKVLWGEDVLEFRPERWEQPPEAIVNVPGVWSHMLTFSGGPRACIGYRFAVTELKAIVFTLLCAFKFELGVSASDVQYEGTFQRRPALRSKPEKGAQLPLLIRPYVHQEEANQ